MTDLTLFSPGTPSGGGGGGDNISVNGTAVTDANFNSTTPVAAAGRVLVEPQFSGASPAAVSMQTPATVPNVLVRNLTNSVLNNSTVRTSMTSCLIPANTLGTNRKVAATISGDYFNNTGASTTFTLEIVLGGTALYNVTTTSIGVGAAVRPFRLVFDLFAKLATNVQELAGSIIMPSGGAPTTGRGTMTGSPVLANSFGGDGALDTTLAQTLELFITLSIANANHTFTVRQAQFVVE